MEKIIAELKQNPNLITAHIQSEFIYTRKTTKTKNQTHIENSESICDTIRNSYIVMVFDDFEVIYTINDIDDKEIELVAEWVEEDESGITLVFAETLILEFDKTTSFCFEEEDVSIGEIQSRSITVIARKDITSK